MRADMSYSSRLAGLMFLLFLNPLWAEGPQSVPLEFTPQGTILLQGLLGDTLKARFVLDTGAGCHVLSHRAFGQVASVPAGRLTSFRIDGTREDRALYEIPSLSVGGSVQVAPEVVVWDRLDSARVDGILSAVFFRNRVVTLDFARRQMVFEDSASLRDRLRNGTIVPVRTRDDRGRSLEIFFDVLAPDNKVLECLFDTGAPTTFEDRFRSSLKVLETNQWLGIDEKGGRQLAWSGRLEYIALAGAPGVGLNNVSVGFMPKMTCDGQIGWNFFTGRVVTFNLPEQYVIIRKQ